MKDSALYGWTTAGKDPCIVSSYLVAHVSGSIKQ